MIFLTNGNVAIRGYIINQQRRWHIIFRQTGSEVIVSEQDMRALQAYDMDGANHHSMGWTPVEL